MFANGFADDLKLDRNFRIFPWSVEELVRPDGRTSYRGRLSFRQYQNCKFSWMGGVG
jgi:hypothetical protein